MSWRTKLYYGIDILVLGGVIFHGVTGNVGMAIAGLGIYALGNVIENLGYEAESSK